MEKLDLVKKLKDFFMVVGVIFVVVGVFFAIGYLSKDALVSAFSAWVLLVVFSFFVVSIVSQQITKRRRRSETFLSQIMGFVGGSIATTIPTILLGYLLSLGLYGLKQEMFFEFELIFNVAWFVFVPVLLLFFFAKDAREELGLAEEREII